MDDYTISSRMAALSHLSDAQELIRMGMTESANNHIKMAKLILIKYKEDTQVTNAELDSIWETKVTAK